MQSTTINEPLLRRQTRVAKSSVGCVRSCYLVLMALQKYKTHKHVIQQCKLHVARKDLDGFVWQLHDGIILSKSMTSPNLC